MASTAYALNGSTLHSLLKLPVNFYGTGKLDDDSLIILRIRFQGVKYLFIDEFF